MNEDNLFILSINALFLKFKNKNNPDRSFIATKKFIQTIQFLVTSFPKPIINKVNQLYLIEIFAIPYPVFRHKITSNCLCFPCIIKTDSSERVYYTEEHIVGGFDFPWHRIIELQKDFSCQSCGKDNLNLVSAKVIKW